MKQVKDLFDVIVETLLFLIIAGGILYFLLCAGVYTAYSADEQLQRNIDNLNEKEKVIAITILAEARGEGNAGMYAVACVIEQRARNRKLAPSKVCLQPWQFSCWNKNDKNRAKLNNLIKTHQHKDYAITLAKNLHRLNRVYSKGADHYCTLEKKPYWAFNKKTKKWIKPVAIIGNHKFYKLR